MKITIKGAVYDTSKTDEPHYVFHATDMSAHWAKISPYLIEVDVPEDYNPVAAKVEILKSVRAETVKEFAGKLAQIDETISKLQCLTNEVEA